MNRLSAAVLAAALLDGGARIDVRSRSRIRRIDRGVKAGCIRSFLAALKRNAAKVSQ